MAAPLPVVQGKVVGRPVDIEQPHPHSAMPHPVPQPAFPEHLEVAQLACRDAQLPPEIRLGFVKKVYGILGMMVVITFGISLPFVFATQPTLNFFHQHVWILYIVGAVFLAQLVFDLAMSCQMCCGGTGLIESYFRMMKTAPWNYLYLTTFSLCFGVLVGFICAKYKAQSVVLVFALTAVLIIALTIYAVRTQADFTGCGAYIMVMILGLIMLILVYSFFPGSVVVNKIIAGVGAMLFGFIIVYDTQLIFGSASAAFGGGKRNIEYTLDMYAFAAFNLYLDFLNFFLYMLQLLGERR
ncbi:GRINA [Symbiodinium natans]|uniref:GRINA protein n=1 Tax=Symbiodinium natans TaxID=878477 RepID=A0A812HUL4_9DINO|nr:GRINA [Symbiodinium natans]